MRALRRVSNGLQQLALLLPYPFEVIGVREPMGTFRPQVHAVGGFRQ